ncbi:hypothetical protein [Symbioplanes lichenis]|uniref:hypothetical protein n=1 Tax=Symbioplanes lichenis TaxID=1629072 RepID=UPI002739642D|nr:hypothetical protein [Actinoplanes lichenis]
MGRGEQPGARQESSGGRHELAVQEARSRLVPLARMTGLTGQVTVLTEGGRALAALVPVEALDRLDAARPPSAVPAQRVDGREEAARWRSRAEAAEAALAQRADDERATQARRADDERAAEARRQAVAEGWQRRLETLREQLRVQHQRRTEELERALAQAWAVVDELRPPGRDRALDQLRAEHRALAGDGHDDAPGQGGGERRVTSY